MAKYKVFKDAQITYEWYEEIEADSEREAIEKVDALVEAIIAEGIDPYGTEASGASFFEIDWSGGEWGTEPVEEIAL